MEQSVVQPYTGKLSTPSWRILLFGLGLALVVAAIVMVWMMRPPVEDVATLILTLSLTSILSLGLGYVLYRNGWTRSPSLRMTLIFTCSWGAVLTFANMWVMAQLMFASEHDLALSVVLLLFTAIIATAYGVFVAASVTDGLRQVTSTARQLAAGDFTSRAHVPGRDEVSQLAQAFNDMAAQLQRAAAQREELEVLRRDLIAWTSHDLRTPLTGIRAMVEALHDQVVTDPATVHRYYQSIRADVIALNHLIDDLFELAQLDAGGLVLAKAPHSLSDLISDTLESFRVLAAERGVKLIGEVGPDLDPVLMNPPKIGRVLTNLLSNALRYAPEGGRVQVIAQRTAGGARVTVEDNGPGFAESDLPRVFEKFYRGEQARSRATGGAGLGLAIAQGIVQAHGGRIGAENVPGGGARVGFLLP